MPSIADKGCLGCRQKRADQVSPKVSPNVTLRHGKAKRMPPMHQLCNLTASPYKYTAMCRVLTQRDNKIATCSGRHDQNNQERLSGSLLAGAGAEASRCLP